MGLFAGIKKANKKVKQGLATMHLEGVAKLINPIDAIKDPKGTLKAIGRDTKFGVSVFARYYTGQWGS